MDSPGDTEFPKSLKDYSSKGYQYSKILIYIMSEEKTLDADSLKNNENLEKLIESLARYKIPLFILLTYSDKYCIKIKEDNNDWKNMCKEHLDNNKKNLINHINELLEKKFKCDFKMDENNIMHIVLVEQNKISDEEIIKSFDEKTKEEYDKADDAEKKMIIKYFSRGKSSTGNEVSDFIKKDFKALDKKELSEKIRENLPSLYHSVLNL